ncbi:gastrula zinc finger protein XlCGF17.1-like [Xyrichtys novacula]|uniref:Gastrula zinc finger protein XlCGF17.1-like n=1 Tax=Xyrichtys novacula TaxID=13765 RepID=A0AAV1FYK4_XYRNO|nr:gastrula zinc finger protein XlCGF17.1-like [Xyrichtys novacula]
MKEEDTPVQISEMKEHTQVKEEDVDVSITPDIKKETSNSAEVPKSEPTSDSERFPSSPTAEESVNQSIDDDEWNEVDGASSPDQGPSIEVIVNLEQPARDEKICRFCGRNFRKDIFLIRHVNRIHKEHKAFKCLVCNKEFDQRLHLVVHTKVHTGAKTLKCDFCDRTFTQNSSYIVHMRVHTREKPYFRKNCGKTFAVSKHLKQCDKKNKYIIPPKKGKNIQEKTPNICLECKKVFRYKNQLLKHARIHTGEKPFSCEICGKTFAQSSTRNVHLRVHSEEKPYFCKNCGKKFKCSKHLKLCRSRGGERPFRCLTCGRTFFTNSDLEMHFEVHEAWKRHLNEKVQET